MTGTATAERSSTESDRIEAFFDGLSTGDTITIRREAIDPTGRPIFPIVDVLRSFEGMTDLGDELFKLAEKKRWPAGRYRVELRQPGKKGIQRQAYVEVEPPSVVPADAGASVNVAALPQSPADALRQAREVAEVLNESKPGSSAYTDAMKAGIDIAKSAAEPAWLGSLAAAALPLVSKFLERVSAPPPSPEAGLEKTIALFDKFGLLHKPANGDAVPGDVTSLTERMAEFRQMVELVESMSGGGAGEESTIVQVVKILGPQLPVVVDRLTGTVNNALDYARMRLTAQMPGGVAVPGGLNANPSVPIASAASAAPSPGYADFLAALRRAVAADDRAFFAPLAQAIAIQIPGGPEFLASVQAGTTGEESALSIMAATGLVNLRDPQTRQYALTFLHWLRTPQGEQVLAEITPTSQPGAAQARLVPERGAANPSVTATCEQCGARFFYDSVAEYERDTRLCDVVAEGSDVRCGGAIRAGDEWGMPKDGA